MASGLTPTVPASEIVERTDWLGSFARFHPTGASAVKFAFYHVYVGGYRATYLPFLWTMPIELTGSFLLLLTLFVFPRIKGGIWIVFGLAYVLVATDSYIGCFLIGMLLGKARADGLYGRLPRVFRRYAAPLGILVALMFVGNRQITGNQDLRGLTGAGTALLFCAYSSREVVGFLARNRISQFLGRISFLLYLWHFTVLVTLTSSLIVWSGGPEGMISTPGALLIGLLTVSVSLALAHFTLAIEGWARSVNGLILRWCWKDEHVS